MIYRRANSSIAHKFWLSTIFSAFNLTRKSSQCQMIMIQFGSNLAHSSYNSRAKENKKQNLAELPFFRLTHKVLWCGAVEWCLQKSTNPRTKWLVTWLRVFVGLFEQIIKFVPELWRALEEWRRLGRRIYFTEKCGFVF